MKLIIRKASVRWKGGAKGGTRAVTTQRGAKRQSNLSLTFPFKRDSDTDPAEFIAAAHASSFSLALSDALHLRSSAAGEILTTSTVTLQHFAEGWTIVKIHLDVVATFPKKTQNEFIDATVLAKTSCLVSRLLRANISMTAKLEK